jgi:peptidoglycan hydrolase CwlO-like protein
MIAAAAAMAIFSMQAESLRQSFCSLQRTQDGELEKGGALLAQAHADIQALEKQVSSLEEKLSLTESELECVEKARDALSHQMLRLTMEMERISEVQNGEFMRT